MKKFRTSFMFILSYICVVGYLTSLSAVNVLPGKYINGVSSINYYLSADYNWYGQQVPVDGMNRWQYNSSYIRFNRQYNNYGTKLDWYISYNGTYGNYGTLGHTEFWGSNETMISPSYNWYYAKIFLNSDTNLTALRGYDAVVGTASHEVGHALGLDHTSNAYEVMSQSSIRKVQTPTSNEIYAVHKKYGY